MTYIPELKVEVVDLINKSNGLSIGENDIELSSPVTDEILVEAKVTPGNGDYYGKSLVSYRRREPGKFFTNIPVFAAMDNLGKTVTGYQVIGVINSYWPGLIEQDDIETDDLAAEFTLGELMSKPAQFRFKTSSQAWLGTFSLSVIQRFINLGYIVSSKSVTLENPSTYSMASYYADFTRYGKLINSAGSSGVLNDDLAYLLGRGLKDVNIVLATVLYNGTTAGTTDYKVNTDYSHVLLLKPSGGADKDVVYINYNYDSVPVNAVVTESGSVFTDESGQMIVLE